MKKPLLLIDGNSVGFASQAGTTLTAGEREVQAIFGFLRTVKSLVDRHPGHTPIVLWDGRSQWRYDLYPGYKDRSGKSTKMDDMRAAYKEQVPDIMRGLSLLGITQMKSPEAEADDLAAKLSMKAAERGQHVLLITGDKDWLQLVNEFVSWQDHRKEKTVTLATFTEETGCLTPDAFVQAKALMGDPSDTIRGVGGIGEKGAVEFLAEYGSVDEFFRRVDAEEIDPEKLKAAHRRFAYNDIAPRNDTPMRDAYHRNLALMDLRNTPPLDMSKLKTVRSHFDEEGFADFCASHFFNSIVKNFGDWVSTFQRFAPPVRAAAS